jgi:8-amino-7-oxononanoate synthase
MDSLDRFAAEKLAALEARTHRRVLRESARTVDAVVVREGRRFVSFSCNDYLGLAHHPAVVEAAAAAVRQYGAGSGASRLVTGEHPLLGQLEARLAALKETEDALVFGSGFLANTGVIPALVGADDLVLVDALSHACLQAGARLSRARVEVFRHNDAAHVSTLLAEHRAEHPRCIIATDGVFSMDGDLPPLTALADLADAHDAWLLTDDAHGLGVIGDGRGSTVAAGARGRVPLQVGTLSKALGSYGGYLCASAPVVDLMRSRARTLVYSTALPPASAAAALAALDVMEGEPDRRARPLAHARMFCDMLGRPAPESPIVPVVFGGEQRALDASATLAEAGFLVTAIRPPTVPAGSARLRFTFSAAHRDDDVARVAALARTLLEDAR